MSNVSFNMAYEGVNQREQNLFREEYYSGTDTKIYFDGIDQKEISHIAYSLQEQLLPIFGYASRTFDTVAVGNRVVNGTFTVSIRNNEEIATAEKIIEAAKTNFEKNEEYNSQELEDEKNNDWVNTGIDTLHHSHAADEMEHKMDNYSMWEEGQDTLTNKMSDADFITILKKNGFTSSNPVLEFQKTTDSLEKNGILDSNTKKMIYAKLVGQLKTASPMSDLVYIYSGPGSVYTKIRKINSGDQYWIEGTVGEWSFIRLYDNTVGYVRTSSLG